MFNPVDLWSCKWELPGDAPRLVGESKTKVSTFLTIPEDAQRGVCCHELGHLLFGWPDFYDITYTSSGNGIWCLMSSGSWGALEGETPGTLPCHPSAWCKLDQDWVDVLVDDVNTRAYLNAVEPNVAKTFNANRKGYVRKLWPNGKAQGKEYFLLEKRVQSGYDASLPGEGLLSKV